MAPADNLSPPGSSSYSSDTLNVGDGTWDFTKNTFLLPNLVGLNFETMQYNGMGNRFSTVAEYHTLILGHGVLAAITFLFIVPIAVLLVRFFTRQPGSAVRYHAYLQILAVGLTTVIFVLGFIAVGPPRNLTNPHHGIGVAIYVLVLLQAFGGGLVRKITGRSFRLHVHRWSGRAITLLGIVQVPLGLTLYGSPKVLFILYALWMGFLLVLYFVLDYRDYGRHEFVRGRAAHSHVDDESSRVTDHHGGKMKWLGPLAIGAGALALFRRKKHKDAERGLSRSPSPVDRPHRATVISSRRESDSYYDEKEPERRRASTGGGGGGGGGFMNKILAAGAGLGAGALISKMVNRNDRRHDDEYSAVATDTPSRRRHHPARSEFTESEYTDRTEDTGYPSRLGPESSVLPPPRPPVVGAGRPPRPMTPKRSHAATSRFDSTLDGSDYSSYVSPSRRTSEPAPARKSGGVGKGLLAGMGLGFLTKMGKDRADRREEERLRDEEERRREEEEERRAGRRNSRYTGDGYPTPTRRDSRRQSQSHRPAPTQTTFTETSIFSDESSIEPRGNTPYDPAPPGFRPPPLGAAPAPVTPPNRTGAAAVPVVSPTTAGPPSTQPSRFDVTDPVSMPPMPADPHGIFHRESDGSEAYGSPNERRRHHSRDPVGVRVRIDGDRPDRVTLHRVPTQEARRRRADSISSQSGNETATGSSRRYRRDSTSRGRAERAAEQRVEGLVPGEDLEPPTPAFAKRAAGKDSAYYSGGAGAAGPSGSVPAAGTTMSSLPESPGPSTAAGAGAGPGAPSLMSPGGSHATFTSGPMTDAGAAADRRRRRRLERRDGSRQPTVEFS
ncbi:uncharacterized protein C8A04DRAFT_9851 [Dichotomopilus funicola]|uniref:Cytochrome b561 domain-containing protein n=1 Tax=Dichotomopilus funicola TaxID=1934379 RepID=A0AAN6V7G3_9PEZI|nr:hypothetical protein C8A04DRAFT_9851 [Dichotomopilus funicola]